MGSIEEGEALVRLVFAEALAACDERDAAEAALRSALTRLHERAAKIDDSEDRRKFLEGVPDHVRTVGLAKEWAIVAHADLVP